VPRERGGRIWKRSFTQINHGGNLRGLAAAKEWLARPARDRPPGDQLITEDTIVKGDRVVTRWTVQEGGKAVFTGISIHRIVDGKTIEDWAHRRRSPEP
jgi:predicted ester cyclase